MFPKLTRFLNCDEFIPPGTKDDFLAPLTRIEGRRESDGTTEITLDGVRLVWSLMWLLCGLLESNSLACLSVTDESKNELVIDDLVWLLDSLPFKSSDFLDDFFLNHLSRNAGIQQVSQSGKFLLEFALEEAFLVLLAVKTNLESPMILLVFFFLCQVNTK